MAASRSAYVVWINGVTDVDKLTIAKGLAALAGNGATVVDLSVNTATSIATDKQSQDRARNDALMKFVFPEDRRHKTVIITGKHLPIALRDRPRGLSELTG